MNLTKAVGIRLEQLLRERNMTQYQLSKMGGIPRATIWKIIHPETTENKSCKLITVYEICATLGLSLEEFFSDPIFSDLTD